MTAGYKWKKLQPATPLPPSEELIQVWMDHYHCDRTTALAGLDQESKSILLWLNDLYQVEVRRCACEIDGWPDIIHINIRRTDGYPGRDWRHFQQIKNELLGPEYEAVELYPAEERLTDTSNKYHLWAFDDPTFRFPFGFKDRQVETTGGKIAGLRQRPPMQHHR